MKHRVFASAVIISLAIAPLTLAGPLYLGPRYTPWHRDLADSHFVLVVQGCAQVTENDVVHSHVAILDSIKRGPALTNRTHLKVAASVPVGKKLLVIGDFVKGKPVPYRALPATAKVERYVRGLLVIDVKDEPALARYCVQFIERRDPDVLVDAFAVLGSASHATIQAIGADAPRETLRKIIADRNQEMRHRQIGARLLAGARRAEDARFLRDLLDVLTEQELEQGFSNFLISYTLLDPRKGSDYICSMLEGPELSILEPHFPDSPMVQTYIRRQANDDWTLRYETLLAVRFFIEDQPGVIRKTDQMRALVAFLKMKDMADLVIEDLRRCHRWELTDSVLSIWGKEQFDTNLMRRAIMRYALQCPQRVAATFVARVRESDPRLVEWAEQALKPETGK